MTILPGRKEAEQFAAEREAVGVMPKAAPSASSDAPVSAEQQRLADLLRAAWDFRRTIAALAALGMLFGWLIAQAMGPSYTAVAVLRPNLLSEAPEKGSQAPNLDANLLLESEIEVILSQPLLPAVAIKLNTDFPPDTNEGSLLAPVVNAIGAARDSLKCMISSLTGRSEPSTTGEQKPSRTCPTPTGPAALKDVTLHVNHRSRTYLIEVEVQASTPARAAAFANAIASQYALNIQKKQGRARIIAAQQALTGLLITYGDRHPMVRRARGELEQLILELDSLATAPASVSARDLAGGNIVIPASAAASPGRSSYKIMAIWTLLGLLGGLGLMLYRERHRLLA